MAIAARDQRTMPPQYREEVRDRRSYAPIDVEAGRVDDAKQGFDIGAIAARRSRSRQNQGRWVPIITHRSGRQ